MTPLITLKDERHQRGAVLRVMCLALMMVVAGVASLNVALPELARATGATQTELQWIVDAYALAFAALLLPAGAIGDRFGRKPILIGGLALFGAASAVAMFLDSPGQLIVVRAVLGVAAAFVMPVTLSVITTVFPPEERGKAVGTWAGVAAGGAVLGLLASGILPRVVLVAVDLRPQRRPGDARPRGHDRGRPADARVPAAPARPGRHACCRSSACPPSSSGSSRYPSAGGTDPVNAGALVAGRRRIVAVRPLGAPAARADARPAELPAPRLRGRLAVDHGAVLRGVRLPVPRAPVPAARARALVAPASVGILPMALVVIPLSRVAPTIAGRVGIRVAGAVGLSLMAMGFLVVSTLGSGSSYWHVPRRPDPVRCRHGARRRPGHDAPSSRRCLARSRGSRPRSTTSRASSAVRSASPSSAACSTTRPLGSLRPAAGLPPEAAEQATSSLAAALQIGESLGAQGTQLVATAQSAFMDGMTLSMIVGATFLAVGAAFVALRAPGRSESKANAEAPAAEGASRPSRTGLSPTDGASSPARRRHCQAAFASGEQRPKRGVELPVAAVERVVDLPALGPRQQRLGTRARHAAGSRRHVGVQPDAGRCQHRGAAGRRLDVVRPGDGQSGDVGADLHAAGRRGRRLPRRRARSADGQPPGWPRARRAARTRFPPAAPGPGERDRGTRRGRTIPPARRRSIRARSLRRAPAPTARRRRPPARPPRGRSGARRRRRPWPRPWPPPPIPARRGTSGTHRPTASRGSRAASRRATACGWSSVMPSGSSTGRGHDRADGLGRPHHVADRRPGSTTPAPRVAAMSSPQPSTTWVEGSSPAASRSQGATGPRTACAGRTGASDSESIWKAAHASGDQSPLRDVEEHRRRRVRRVDRQLPGGMPGDERARQEEPAGARRAGRRDARGARRSSRPRGPDRGCSR